MVELWECLSLGGKITLGVIGYGVAIAYIVWTIGCWADRDTRWWLFGRWLSCLLSGVATIYTTYDIITCLF